jgi:hypothetical protein
MFNFFSIFAIMKISNHETYKRNPFTIEAKYIRTYTKEELNKNTGEIETKVKVGDFEDHIRIFPSAFTDFGNLNSMAVQIMSYTFQHVADDVIRLNVKELMEYFGITSSASIYRGISCLLQNEFMARKVGGDTYFINPAKFYPGSRASWYKKYMDECTKG